MKIKILIDNISGLTKQLKGEWGLCVYTEFNGKRILLDTGASAQFAKNTAILGIDISQIDAGILSHAHYDHANGMQEFFKHNNHAKFYLRDSAAENCYHTHKVFGLIALHVYIGIHKGWLKRFADRIRFVEGDAEIAPGITLVPHKTAGLESIGERAHLSVKENGNFRYDSFEHEQSLVFDTPRGLFVMNSCSHGGADNIVKEIAATFPDKKIFAILGGFHLFRYKDSDIRAFAERLRELDVQKIYTGHCTGDRAFKILHEILGDRAEQMFTGMSIEV